MNINISNANGEPIYLQIADQIKTLILEGKLREGEALPSMRVLATELRISFTVPKGCIMGFIGQNGAGKTTTARSLLRITNIGSGEIRLLGMDHAKDEKAIKKQIAALRLLLSICKKEQHDRHAALSNSLCGERNESS